MKREPFVEDVDDVCLGSGTIGTFGSNRVDITVDGGQFRIDDQALVDDVLKMLVQHFDGVPQFLLVLVDGILLSDKRLFDADIIECVLADGVDGRGEKNIPLLSKKLNRGGC